MLPTSVVITIVGAGIGTEIDAAPYAPGDVANAVNTGIDDIRNYADAAKAVYKRVVKRERALINPIEPPMTGR